VFLGLCALVIVCASPVAGGRLSRLGALQVRWVPLAVFALALQVFVITIWPAMPHGLAVAGHLFSYAMLASVVWVNRRIPGMMIIGLGAGSNAVAITANDGTLPASAYALRTAGITPHVGFQNSGILAHPHLAWLGDIMVTPAWLPLRNMLSVGDIVLLVGAAYLVFRATHDTSLDGVQRTDALGAACGGPTDPDSPRGVKRNDPEGVDQISLV
jgi:Family of unknown function (DUF5317)